MSKITHQESDTRVYFSKDYGLFRMKEGNRQLNERKINKIKSDIAGGLNILRYAPIIVNENDGRLDIIDGQHRFYVSKQLKLPVWYVLAPGSTLLDIAKINSKTESWKAKDYINCYSVQGNKNYEDLDSFMSTYGFPLSVSIKLLEKGTLLNDSGSEKEDFQAGNFKAAKLNEAIKIADIVMKFVSFKGFKSRTFIVAICRILDAGKVDIKEVIDAFTSYPDKLTVQVSWKEYLTALEVILNHNKKTRRIIY